MDKKPLLLVKNKYGKVMAVVEIDTEVSVEIPRCVTFIDSRYDKESDKQIVIITNQGGTK